MNVPQENESSFKSFIKQNHEAIRALLKLTVITALGAALIGLGDSVVNNDFIYNDLGNYKTNINMQKNEFIIGGCYATGIVCFIVAIYGIITLKYKNYYVAIPFATFAFCCAGICIMIGSFMIYKTRGTDWTTWACNTQIEGLGMTGNDVIQQQYGLMVNKFMCSSVCPCNISAQAKFQALGEPKLRTYYRTMNPTAAETTQAADPKLMKQLTTIIPMVFVQSPNIFYENYADCFNSQILNISSTSDDPNFQKQYQEFALNGAVDFLTQFESLLDGMGDCAGFCQVPLFYISKSANIGPPTQECLSKYLPYFQQYTQTGIIALVNAVVLLFLLVSAYQISTQKEFLEKQQQQKLKQSWSNYLKIISLKKALPAQNNNLNQTGLQMVNATNQ